MDTSTVLPYDPLRAACPTRQVLTRIGDKWSMLVIIALQEDPARPMRFSKLRRRIDGVTQKMLTQTLRGLERDGLVVREAFPTVPVTVQYTLTPFGHGLAEAVAVILSWAVEHIEELDEARERFDARPRSAGPPTPRASAAAG